MSNKVGAVVVRTFSDHIEVAHNVNNKGFPRFLLGETLELALSGLKGVDPWSALPNLTLLDSDRNTSFVFLFQRSGEVTLPKHMVWVSVDVWSSQPWGSRWQSFVKEASAVLAAFDRNYAEASSNPEMVQARTETAEHARSMVMVAGRRDLVFGVTINLLMAYDEAWYKKYRVDWLLRQDHSRAVQINKAAALALERCALLRFIKSVPITGPMAPGVAEKLFQLSTSYIEMFGKPCFDFQAEVWMTATLRLEKMMWCYPCLEKIEAPQQQQPESDASA